MLDWLAYDFMQNALIAVLLITPLFGLIGTMVVNQRMAFFSDSLGHSTFTGIAIGTLAGIAPIPAAAIFAVMFAWLITWMKYHSSVSMDTIIGIFSSTAVALGIVIMSHGGSFGKFTSYLIGDLLSVTESDLVAIGIVLVVTAVMWVFLFHPLLMASVNPLLARSRGARALEAEMVFASLVAVVVTLSVQWVGILIINSMLVLPAAAARSVASDIRSYQWLTVLFAMVSGTAGLVISYYCDTAPGATMVLVAAVIFFVTIVVRFCSRTKL